MGGVNKDKSRHIKSYKILGKNIRALREDRKMSQEELAFRILSARNYIGCIERGEKIPSIAIILDIAEALHCKIEEIVREM